MKFFLSVGERSAEKYAFLLAQELKKADSSIEILSFGSDLLATQSQKIADYKDISVIGFKEALSVVPKAVEILNVVKKAIIKNNIDALVLMDFPDFNMQLAKFANKNNIKVIYYITPQLWAWRKSRIRQLFKYVDLIIPILPFERTFFNTQSVKHNFDFKKVAYFGHPLVDILHDYLEKRQDKEKIILILPGSRMSELHFHTKNFFEAAYLLKKEFSDYKFVVATQERFLKYFEQFKSEFPFIEFSLDTYDMMKKASFAITKSGTVTLEAALFGLPCVVAYKLSNLSYIIGKALIHGVDSIALPNIIYGKKIIPELIQFDATPKKIYEYSKLILQSNNYQRQIKHDFKQISYALGNYPVTPKIAKTILDYLA
ncbi:lipid-A-disaccharide synthase [Desulfurella multipotens]|uniref:Lipid-A-disaccharide synthase n=1 Tax=Desulfurella multipotens TaxID=79269 RepID=A0A1G6KUS6_9BACT|nr:lipid-A-disaccharide synthase [Desulfurella multipotens]SDC34842.1 lipid-A-disaccharide synthase [Desulfurella multipotens]